MKSTEEIDRELKDLSYEAEIISRLLIENIIRDDKIKESLIEREKFCRNKVLALLWVLGDTDERRNNL
jgi:hypothetical protein